MVSACASAGVPFSIHENWRWQTPIRALKQVLDSGDIGPIFRARIDYCNSFPVFDNQPFLRTLDHFIVADMGSHILDVARFLFGEAGRVYCQTHRVHRDIKGEDAASVVMQMRGGATVTCNLSYASVLEQDRFPEAFMLIEGENGSVELAPDYWLRVTTKRGTQSRPVPSAFLRVGRSALCPRAFEHRCLYHTDLLKALRNNTKPETSAEDNLKTLRLVHSAYESAANGQAVQLTIPDNNQPSL